MGADAIALLQLTIMKPKVGVGDTVHARLEAFDDAGGRVTTSQMIWTSSNPRVVRFMAPGDLIAAQEGKATITVSAAGTSATKEVVVGPKAVPAKGPAVSKAAKATTKS